MQWIRIMRFYSYVPDNYKIPIPGSCFTKKLTTNRRRNSMLKDRRYDYDLS